MATTTNSESLDYSILGKEVSIGSVDKELRLLWESDEANTNASLINLAIYSEAEGTILENSEVIHSITHEHACRALLIEINREAPEASIRAWITTHCNLSGGKKSVCCEQIAFHLTGCETGRLENTVFAHLNSDLPLVFWWQGELSSIFAERLYSLIDRFVYDSAEWANPLESFKVIEQAINGAGHFLPMDLEWTRTYQIRLAMAGLFDDPVASGALSKLSNVRIVANPSHETAALQLLAWLVKSMGWKLEDKTAQGEYRFKSTDGVSIIAGIELDASSAPVGALEVSSPECVVKVCREAGSGYLHQELQAGDYQLSTHTPANKDEPSELVIDQLSRGGKNTLYSTMLPAFIDLLDS